MTKAFVPAENVEWRPIRQHLSLNASGAANDAKSLPTESAIYLWTVVAEGREIALYVGRASSLSRRIYNYTQPFQPHSPNDRKLCFAQEALEARFEDPRFPLYWKPVAPALLNESEHSAVKLLDPLLNRRGAYAKDHAVKLEAAYKNLYFEVLAGHLGEA